MTAEQVLAFRLARSDATCPASDFSPGAALLAHAARDETITRERYAEAVDAGDIVVAHVVRGAIHAIAPADHALYGRALIAADEDELTNQLGEQVRRLKGEHGVESAVALGEVTAALEDALKHRKLDKVALHEELRQRVRDELLPWCKGCESHHVAPMLWRYATVAAGARLDSARGYVASRPGKAPAASEAVRRFLGFYGPSTPNDFADWAGVAKPHARRLWAEVEQDLAEVDGRWLLADDVAALESPPTAEGVLLLPPGDPYLQKPNRALLAPDKELRGRLFRPVASPGAVIKDGRLVGLWRAKAKGKKTELTVEKLGRIARKDLERPAARIAELRGAADVALVVG